MPLDAALANSHGLRLVTRAGISLHPILDI